MSKIQLAARLGAEHALSDGRFVPFTATSRVSATPLRAGDRVWLDLDAPGASAAYVVAQRRDFTFEVWAAFPDAVPHRAFPSGHVVDVAPWKLWVIAAAAPVAWLTDVSGALDCSAYASAIAPEAPTDRCGYLAGLHRLAPPAVRAPAPTDRPTRPGAGASLPTGDVQADGASLRGFSASHARAGEVAVSFSIDAR